MLLRFCASLLTLGVDTITGIAPCGSMFHKWNCFITGSRPYICRSITLSVHVGQNFRSRIGLAQHFAEFTSGAIYKTCQLKLSIHCDIQKVPSANFAEAI